MARPNLFFGVCLALLLAAQIGVSEPASAQEPDDIFQAPARHVGEHVHVRGYLLYRFENKNLYPTSSWERDHRAKSCLPMAVDLADSKLQRQARKFDGKYVVISGEIEVLLEGEEINPSFCKNVGMVVRSISAANE